MIDLREAVFLAGEWGLTLEAVPADGAGNVGWNAYYNGKKVACDYGFEFVVEKAIDKIEKEMAK